MKERTREERRMDWTNYCLEPGASMVTVSYKPWFRRGRRQHKTVEEWTLQTTVQDMKRGWTLLYLEP
jgi:hypothetical protein